MESGEILTSLAKLEASLNEIKSAKEQVQQTVGAYASVQRQIGEYTTSLDTIAGSIKAIITDVQSQRTALNEEAAGLSATLNAKAAEIITMQKTSSDAILDSLKTNLDATSDSFSSRCVGTVDAFKQNTEAEIQRLDDNIETLRTCAANLNSLHENIKSTLNKIDEVKQDFSGLKQEMMASQEAQDTKLEAITTDIASLSAQQSSALTNLSRELKNAQDAQDKTIADLSTTISSLYEKLYTNEMNLAKGHTAIIILTILNLLAIIGAMVITLLKITI